MNRFWQVAVADAVILLALLVCWSAAENSSADTGIALGFAFMVGFIFISAPVFAATMGLGVSRARQVGYGQAKGVVFYLCLSTVAHLGMAYGTGFFDKWIDEYKRDARAREFPALTQLQYAVARGPVSDIGKVRGALAQGADPNGGSYGDPRIPLLVLAAGRSDAPVIEALLAAGADPNQRSALTHGTLASPSPLDLVLFSEHEGQQESMELLLAAGADATTSMLKPGACFLGSTLLYQRAATLGAPDRADVKQNNCLHHAAEQNRIELLQALLLDPAYTSPAIMDMLAAPNHIGQYPLDTAVAEENFAAALLIAQAGGLANKPWTVERVLKHPGNKPELEKLKVLLMAQEQAVD